MWPGACFGMVCVLMFFTTMGVFGIAFGFVGANQCAGAATRVLGPSDMNNFFKRPHFLKFSNTRFWHRLSRYDILANVVGGWDPSIIY